MQCVEAEGGPRRGKSSELPMECCDEAEQRMDGVSSAGARQGEENWLPRGSLLGVAIQEHLEVRSQGEAKQGWGLVAEG